jgi:hypothetical protein
VTTDETAEVRALDFNDFPEGDALPDDAPTARVLVEFPREGAGRGGAALQATPEKTINIQQGGEISRIRVKLSTPGGPLVTAKWHVVRRGGTLAIRVDLDSTLQQLPTELLPPESQVAETAEGTPNCILWVVLERNQSRDWTAHSSGPAGASHNSGDADDTQAVRA